MKRSMVGLAAVLLVSCSAFAEASKAAPKSWRAKMGELSAALSDTIPFLYPDPSRDGKQLGEKIKRLYQITQQLDGRLNHSVQMPDSDPALPYIAGMLRSDIERAYQSVQEGHTEYAKSVVRSSVAYCIACHTRTKSGAEFPVLAAFSEPLKRASWIEKIEFQAASRQFDAVLSEVMKQLESPGTVAISPLDLERGSRIALSLNVRVKQDPTRTAFLAKAISQSPSATLSMKEGAKVWAKDIEEWKRDKDKTYSSAEDLMKTARALTGEAQAEGAPLAEHSEVRFLRASVLMHELMRRYPTSDLVPEALYIVGLAYDSLRELGLWSLHEMYFLACIDKAPHTALSGRCFRKFQESVTLGYTGSSGTNIPKAVRSHLNSLKERAQP